MLTAEDVIEKKRLENIFFSALQNDIAGVFRKRILVLGEHQSTINNNIPVRFLMYVGQIFEQLLAGHKKYETSLIKIPTPEFYIFYNGKAEWGVKELKLSDAFADQTNPFINLELKVALINIRVENNSDILNNCEILYQYSKFVQAYESFKGSQCRMEDTMRYCIEHDILAEYIQRKGKKVMGMLTAEWDEIEAREVAREEGREEGREKGREEGREKGREEGIKAMIEGCNELGVAKTAAYNKVKDKFSLSDNEVKGYFERYWK
ncbi:MAG: Rpn family recombination-promoting nuclease/putative transposase [Lachnospiraceae bacterium]|nr:Rpn family recombination-promoting nuclease/putative transposase [Lachnospiraceae bacterium]